ncbi:MAG: isopeptide-forming domain-containing fimbrial protein [Clostridia bacterium]|nr:isopeptide-forming domain-containing fimbrial protein [Clostridia bacterium]
MKKILSVILIALMLLSLSTVSFAAGNGSITISNAAEDTEYDVYKLLDFTSNGDFTGIYTIAPGWEAFFTSDVAKSYFDLIVNGDRTTVVFDANATIDQTFAKAAVAYADANGIDATATRSATNKTVEFTGLDYGYYAINTSLGILCSLTNANSSFTAIEKNTKPYIDKWVKEDSTDTWNKVNDADIDQMVEYKSEITVSAGAVNYIMHDKMDAGLTFNNDVVVKLDDSNIVDPANYSVVTHPDDGDTFDIIFDDSFIFGLVPNSKITVYYSATLNRNANITDNGNDDTVKLTYGDNKWESAEHKTSTYTWKMDFLKYSTDGDNKLPLAGAQFQLIFLGNAIKFTAVEGAAVPTYMVDTQGTIDNITTDENGKFELIGLDEGIYRLREVEAPAGYNKLAGDIEIKVTSDRVNEDLTATYQINNADHSTIEVENKTGSLLPESGDIGTSVFVMGGALMIIIIVAPIILVIAAIVLVIVLVVRKKKKTTPDNTNETHGE